MTSCIWTRQNATKDNEDDHHGKGVVTSSSEICISRDESDRGRNRGGSSSPSERVPLLVERPGTPETSDDVFMRESAFGNFAFSRLQPPPRTLTLSRNPERRGADEQEEARWFLPIPTTPPPSPRPKRRYFRSTSSRRSSVPSTSSEPEDQHRASVISRQTSVKRLFRRSLSVLRHSHSFSSDRSEGWRDPIALALTSPSCGATTSTALQQVSSGLLHVYRNNTFPPDGLRRFHEQVYWLMFSGDGGLVVRWWRGEVLPSGTRMLAVKVASPRDGDRLAALLQVWQSLYTTILPILQALLAPLNNLNVRGDVLSWFRDAVLPYADLPALCTSRPAVVRRHSWKLKQMALLLARVGPCTCDLSDDREVGEATEERKMKKDTISMQEGHTINEVVGVLLGGELQHLGIPERVLWRLLHLHHGGVAHLHASHHHQRQLDNLKRLEEPPSPGQWLTRAPNSVLTLEELLRSAASR